jgi:predicted ABC-type ATPase
MAERASLVTETVFSHPSKLALVREAKTLGYRVAVYHVGLATPEHAVARVAFRERRGGHPVPEANIRARYERNAPLIREAVLLADRAFVFDNSRLGVPPRRLLTFVAGQVTDAAADIPTWAGILYAPELANRTE